MNAGLATLYWFCILLTSTMNWTLRFYFNQYLAFQYITAFVLYIHDRNAHNGKQKSDRYDISVLAASCDLCLHTEIV